MSAWRNEESFVYPHKKRQQILPAAGPSCRVCGATITKSLHAWADGQLLCLPCGTWAASFDAFDSEKMLAESFQKLKSEITLANHQGRPLSTIPATEKLWAAWASRRIT